MTTCAHPGCDIKARTMKLCVKHYSRLLRYGDSNICKRIARSSQPLIERFMEQCIPITECGCWIWIGPQTRGGYGCLQVNGSLRRANRVSYSLFNGRIPKGMHVLHKCDLPECVNPNHLFIGTSLDNTLDMIKKGRQADHKGTNHFRSKFTEIDIINIRSSTDKVSDIAKRYNVVNGAIYNILRRRTWKHIESP